MKLKSTIKPISSAELNARITKATGLPFVGAIPAFYIPTKFRVGACQLIAASGFMEITKDPMPVIYISVHSKKMHLEEAVRQVQMIGLN